MFILSWARWHLWVNIFWNLPIVKILHFCFTRKLICGILIVFDMTVRLTIPQYNIPCFMEGVQCNMHGINEVSSDPWMMVHSNGKWRITSAYSQHLVLLAQLFMSLLKRHKCFKHITRNKNYAILLKKKKERSVCTSPHFSTKCIAIDFVSIVRLTLFIRL